jgi:cytochrome b
LFATDEDFYAGPLNGYLSGAAGRSVTEFHGFNFNVLLALIVLHIVAVVGYLLFKRENLIGAMITGHKRASDIDGPGIERSLSARAILVVALAAAIVAAIANWL